MWLIEYTLFIILMVLADVPIASIAWMNKGAIALSFRSEIALIFSAIYPLFLF